MINELWNESERKDLSNHSIEPSYRTISSDHLISHSSSLPPFLPSSLPPCSLSPSFSLSYLDKIGTWLDNHDKAHMVKVKKQYELWNENVYGEIARTIEEKLEAKPYKEILDSRLEHFDKFLEVTNTKGSVFRDIIIESEYDPLEPNRNAIKGNTKRLKDPIKRPIQRTLEEKGIFRKEALVTRETLDVLEWATGRIEATPHGFFAKMMNDSNRKPNANKLASMDSKITNCLDQYNVAKGKEVLDKEFPRGKKTKKEKPMRADEDFLKND
jgi:hypothetical protein